MKGGNDQYIDFIPVINTWYHFVYTYSGGGNVELENVFEWCFTGYDK